MRKEKLYTNNLAMQQGLRARETALEARARELVAVHRKSDIEKMNPGIQDKDILGKANQIYPQDYRQYMDKIAPYAENDINDFRQLSNKTVFLSSSDHFPGRSKNTPDPRIEEVYSDTGRRFFQAITGFNQNTKKIQTGQELIQNVINFNTLNYQYSSVRNSASIPGMKKSYNELKNSKKFAAYDLETLGGTNAHGYKDLDAVTEFAYKTYDRQGKQIGDALQNVVGLSDPQFKEFEEEIGKIEKYGIQTDRQKVIADRLAKYGHEGTKIGNPNAGQHIVEGFAGELNPSDMNSTKAMRRGLAELRRIGAEQEGSRLSNGLMLWQQQFAEMISNMNGDTPLVGFNDIQADRPWMNQISQKIVGGMNQSQRDAFMSAAGFAPDVKVPVVNPKTGVDVLTIARSAANATGKASRYIGEDAIGMLDHNMSSLKQEALGRLYYGADFDGMAAHTAGFDVDILAKLVATPRIDGQSVLDTMMTDIENGSSKVKGALRMGGKDLLFSGGSQSFNPGGSDPMNFVHDAMENAFKTFNGYMVQQDGTASKELYGQYGIKRNRFYTPVWSGQLDMTEEWVKNISGVHNEMGQGQLFATMLKPVVDPNVAGVHQGMSSPTYLITDSKERMEGILSTFLKTGEMDEKNNVWKMSKHPEARKEVIDALTMKSIENGTIKDEGFRGLDGAITHATKADMNEQAARMVREDSLKKASAFNALYQRIENVVSAGLNGAPVTTAQAKSALHQMMNNHDLELSGKVASGETISMSFKNVQEILGFKNQQTGERRVLTETMDKYTTAFDYMASQRGISDAIIKHIGEDGGKEAKQFRYEQILNQLKAQAVGNMTKSPTDAARLLSGAEKSMVFARDTNYFNFDMAGFFKDSDVNDLGFKFQPDKEENILRVNLAPNKEYGLVNDLLRRTTNLGKVTGEQRNLHGINILKRFVGHVREQDEHKELFKGLSKSMHDFNSADALAEVIQRELVQYRGTEKGAAAGYITGLSVQDVTKNNAVMDHLSQNLEQYVPEIESIDKSLPQFQMVNKMTKNDERVKIHAETIVDKILMKDLKVEGKAVSAFEYAKAFGHDDVQATMFEKTHRLTRHAYIEGITKFTQSLIKTDATLLYDAEKDILATMLNGEYIGLHNLPRIKGTDGVMYAQVGNNRVAVHTRSNFNDAVSKSTGAYSPSNAKIESTLAHAFNETFSVASAFEKGQEKNDLLQRVKSWTANLAENMRTGGSSVNNLDMLDSFSTLTHDYTELVNVMPLMAKQGLLNDVKFRDAGLLEIANDPRLSYKTMNSMQRETIQKNIPILMRIAHGMGLESDVIRNDGDFIAKHIGATNKETGVSEFRGNVGGNSLKFGYQLDNSGRPVLNQVTRAVNYRASDWEQGMADNPNRTLAIGSVFGNGSDKIAGRKVTGLRPGADKTEQVMRIGKVNMAHVEFQNMILKSYLSKKSLDQLSDRDKVVLEMMKGINLTEQERVMDTRVVDSFFDRMEEQKINARKELALSLENNQATINRVNSLAGIQQKLEIGADGKISFSYSKGRNVSRMDPILHAAGFGDLDEVYGSKFRKGRFNFGYFTKAGGLLATEEDVQSIVSGAKSKAEALDILKETYDSRYYVDNMEQSTYKKFAVGYAEKGMTYQPFVPMGAIDQKVSSYLRGVGRGDDIGLNLRDDYLKEIVDDKAFVAGHGFDSAEDLRKAVYGERHAVFDDLRKIFERNGLSEDFSMIGNDSIAGHKNAMLGVEEATSHMVEIEKRRNAALSDRDAIKTVFDKLQSKNVFAIEGIKIDPETGRISGPNNWIGGEDNINVAAMRDVAKEHYGDEMTWQDDQGETRMGRRIDAGGTYTVSSINAVQDNEGMTASGSGAKIDEKLRLKALIRDNTIDKNSAEYQKALTDYGELNSIENAMSRGKKITDREIQLLNLQRFDQGYVDTMQRAYESGSITQRQFEKIAGHVLQKNEDGSFLENEGNYVLDNSAKGVPVLKGYTSDIAKRFLHEKGQEVFSPESIGKNEYYSDRIRDDMLLMAEKLEGKHVISTNKAEQMYSVGKAMEAVAWNSKQVTNLSRMEDLGFEHKDLSGVLSSVGHDADYILRNDGNVFNRNLMVDLGEHAGDNRYLALPFTAPRIVGEDNLVKFEFQRQIRTLANRQGAIEESRASGKPQDFDNAVSRYREAITDTQASLRREIFGKDALASMTSYRADGAINGKASFTTPLDPGSARYREHFGDDMADTMKALADDRGGISSINSKALSDAQFMGSSLLDHYEKGVNIDGRFASEQAFEYGGYFTQDYMDTAGVKSKEEMMEHLRTTGVMVDSTRYPTIKEGSTKPTMMYLDDTLKGNRVKLTTAGALAATTDADGDTLASNAIRDPLTNMDSLQMSLRGKATDGVLEGEHWRNLQGYMVYRGAGVNQFWDDEAHKMMKKDMQKSVANGDLMTITGSHEIDGKIYAEFSESPGQKAIVSNTEKYGRLMEMVQEKHGSVSTDYRELVDQVDSTIKGHADEDMYKKAFIFEDAFSRSEVSQMAKVRKLTIGEANVPLFRLRMASEIGISGLAEGDEARRNMLQATAEIMEQEVISSKKGNLRDYTTKTQEFKSALSDLMYGSEQKRQSGSQDMRAWLEKNARQELIDAAHFLKTKNSAYDFIPEGADDDKIFRTMSDSFVDTVGSLNTQQLKRARAFDSMSSEFIKLSNAASSITDRGTLRDTFFNVLNDSGVTDQTSVLGDAPGGSYRALSGSGSYLSDGRKWLAEEGSTSQNIKGVIRGISETLGEISKNVDGKTLAMGAMGIAGAYMMAGFVGGNPSEPADMQAAKMEDYAEVPSLQDPGLAASQPMMNGYVVNINARSKQGKQHAMDALQSAVTQSTSTNVNIAMNINQDNGNIDDRYVDRLLAGALN